MIRSHAQEEGDWICLALILWAGSEVPACLRACSPLLAQHWYSILMAWNNVQEGRAWLSVQRARPYHFVPCCPTSSWAGLGTRHCSAYVDRGKTKVIWATELRWQLGLERYGGKEEPQIHDLILVGLQQRAWAVSCSQYCPWDREGEGGQHRVGGAEIATGKEGRHRWAGPGSSTQDLVFRRSVTLTLCYNQLLFYFPPTSALSLAGTLPGN